jgi:hypothetical protein
MAVVSDWLAACQNVRVRSEDAAPDWRLEAAMVRISGFHSRDGR